MELEYGVRFSRRRLWWLVAITVVVSLGFATFTGRPVWTKVHKWWHGWMMEREGRQRADADWAAHVPAKYLDSETPDMAAESAYGMWGGPYFWTEFDPDTGFKIEWNTHEGWEAAYTAEMDELLRRNGKPSWWLPQFPGVKALANGYTANNNGHWDVSSPDFQTTTKIPDKILPALAALRRSGDVDWKPGEPAFLWHSSDYPHVIFFQAAHDDDPNLIVMADDGRVLAKVGMGLPLAGISTGARP